MSTITPRTGSPADARAIAAIYEPYVTGTAISFELTAPTSDLIAARMAGTPRLPWWVAVDGGGVVGFAYASPHRTRAAYRWSVEISVYLASSHRGLGVRGALYRRRLPGPRGLGYVSAVAGITLPNPAGARATGPGSPVPVWPATPGTSTAGGTTSAGGTRPRSFRRRRYRPTTLATPTAAGSGGS